MLSESGVVRSDITSSFGSASGTAEGVPLTIRMKVYDLNGDDATVLAVRRSTRGTATARAATRCTTTRSPSENYLRGVQETDDEGWVEFTSIFPAAYSGRWPHVHFEVYPSLDDATSASNKLRTSQLALPEDVVRRGLRDRRLRAERRQPGADLAGLRQRLQRRLLAAAGQGDRQRRRGVRRDAERAGLSA